MPHGGARAGAGRKRGSRTKPYIVRGALASGLTPLQYMLQIMRDPKAGDMRGGSDGDPAAPFCHARAADVGKKERAAAAAETAGQGSAWGDDLGWPN